MQMGARAGSLLVALFLVALVLGSEVGEHAAAIERLRHLHKSPLVALYLHHHAKAAEEAENLQQHSTPWPSFLELVSQTVSENRATQDGLRSQAPEASSQFMEARQKMLAQYRQVLTNLQGVSQSYYTSHFMDNSTLEGLQELQQMQPGMPAAPGTNPLAPLLGPTAPAQPAKPFLSWLMKQLKAFIDAIFNVIFKGVPTLYNSFMNSPMQDLGCYDPLGRYSYGAEYGRRMYPKTFDAYRKMLKDLVPKVKKGEQCILPLPDFIPVKGINEVAGDFGALWGGVLGGAGLVDQAGRGWGPHTDLPESKFCYTLLETYMRMCAAPERMFFLQTGLQEQNVSSHANNRSSSNNNTPHEDRANTCNRTAASEQRPSPTQGANPPHTRFAAMWSLSELAKLHLRLNKTLHKLRSSQDKNADTVPQTAEDAHATDDDSNHAPEQPGTTAENGESSNDAAVQGVSFLEEAGVDLLSMLGGKPAVQNPAATRGLVISDIANMDDPELDAGFNKFDVSARGSAMPRTMSSLAPLRPTATRSVRKHDKYHAFMLAADGVTSGTRPVQSFPQAGRPATPLRPMRPFIFQLIAGIFKAVFKLVMQIIIMILGIICEVMFPIIFDLLLGGFGPILVFVLPLFLMRFIPLMLDGTLYSQRPPGFSGPDPYDAYGPDSPEPRPFKKPAMEMCYRLLDTWTYKCNVPHEY